jgi:hypothetical protein
MVGRGVGNENAPAPLDTAGGMTGKGLPMESKVAGGLLRWRLTLVVLVACAGCAHPTYAPAASATYMRGPDGEGGWISIVCSGLQQDCLARAAQECPGGYVTADESHAQTSQSSGVSETSNGSFFNPQTTYGVSRSRSASTGEMFIKCRKVQKQAPTKRPAEHNCLRDTDCDAGYTCKSEGDSTGWGVCHAEGQ